MEKAVEITIRKAVNKAPKDRIRELTADRQILTDYLKWLLPENFKGLTAPEIAHTCFDEKDFPDKPGKLFTKVKLPYPIDIDGQVYNNLFVPVLPALVLP